MNRKRFFKIAGLLGLFFLVAGGASAQNFASDPIDSLSAQDNWTGTFESDCWVTALGDDTCVTDRADTTDPLTPTYFQDLTLGNDTSSYVNFVAASNYQNPLTIGVRWIINGTEYRRTVSMESNDIYNLRANFTKTNSTHYAFALSDFQDSENTGTLQVPYDGDDNFRVGLRFDSACNFCTHEWAIHNFDSTVYYAGTNFSDTGGGQETLNDFQALNLIDPPDNTVFVADNTGSVDVDFLFEWITQQQNVDNTDFGLIWRVKNESTGNGLFTKTYDLGTGPSAGSKSETQAFGLGNYTWQLEGTSSEQSSSFSEIFEFDIVSQASSPYDITLISPADGASLPGKKGDAAGDTIDVDLVFDINASKSGTFRVESGQYTNTLVSGSVSTGDNTYNVSYSFEDGNNYTWWVEVDDGQGSTYNSEQFSFSISEFAAGEEPPTQADTDNLVGLIVSGLADFFGLFVDAIVAELNVSGELAVALMISLILAVIVSYFSEFLGLLTFPSMMIVFAEAGWVSGWIVFTIAMFAVGVAIWMISRVVGGD